MTVQHEFKWLVELSLYRLDDDGEMDSSAIARTRARCVDSPLECQATARDAAWVCADAMHCNYADRLNTDIKEERV